MLEIQVGRIVTITNNTVAVITDVQGDKYVIVQHPLTQERERVHTNRLKLLPMLINITKETSIFDVQREMDKNGVIAEFEKTEEYKEWEKCENKKKAGDYERFVEKMKERVIKDLLIEKGLSQ